MKKSVRGPACRQAGFTLIEIMVAISIVAILATIGIIAYTQAQKVGRDAKRKQDLRVLQVALELYYQKNGSYPVDTPTNNLSNLSGWDTLLNTEYINQMPKDPINTTPSALVYGYDSDGSAYKICINLENTNDKDINLSRDTSCQINIINFYGIQITSP